MTTPKRRRLTDPKAAEEPLFADDPPPLFPDELKARRSQNHQPARLVQCVVCDQPATAVAGDKVPLCTWCVENPCAALDILAELMVDCEEQLAAAWAPLETVIARASEAEQLRYAELWNKRVAALGNPEEEEKLARGVWLARSTEHRKKAPGLAKILDAEAGLGESIIERHTALRAEKGRIFDAQDALLSFRQTNDWHMADHLTARLARLARCDGPVPHLENAA